MGIRGVNKVILIGNLGNEPELRYMPNGNAVTNITLATSESWRDKQTGEMREQTEWHRVVLFGKLAEVAGEYLHKGSQVYIEGQLRTRKWTDQSGKDKYMTEVIVNISGTMQMLGNRHSGGDTQQQNNWRTLQQQNKENQLKVGSQSHIPSPNQETNSESVIDFDDEIPF